MQRAKVNQPGSARVAALNSFSSVRGGKFRIGWSQFRDGTIPLHVKVLALSLGAGVTFLLMALEVPIEAIVGFAVPLFGVPLDFMVDGFEVFVFPVLIAAAILPSLVRARSNGLGR
jgi:hypothetical protein